MAKDIAKKTDDVKGVLENGIYTEKDVELASGVKIDVEVIVEQKKLPISYANLIAEGNFRAAIVALLTVKTRRMLEWVGATQEDLEFISPVVERARDAAEDAGIE